MFWHIQCTVRAFFVWSYCLLQMKRGKKNAVACVKNMQTEQSLRAHGYIFHFSINPLDKKAVEEKKHKRDEFLLSGLGRRL